MDAWLYSALNSLVTGGAFGGMAPPDTATPYIVYRQVSSVELPLDSDRKIKSDRWQIDCFAGGNYTSNRTLATSVKEALTVTGLSGGLCIIKSELDFEDAYDEKVEQHFTSADFIVDYQE